MGIYHSRTLSTRYAHGVRDLYETVNLQDRDLSILNKYLFRGEEEIIIARVIIFSEHRYTNLMDEYDITLSDPRFGITDSNSLRFMVYAKKGSVFDTVEQGASVTATATHRDGRHETIEVDVYYDIIPRLSIAPPGLPRIEPEPEPEPVLPPEPEYVAPRLQFVDGDRSDMKFNEIRFSFYRPVDISKLKLSGVFAEDKAQADQFGFKDLGNGFYTLESDTFVYDGDPDFFRMDYETPDGSWDYMGGGAIVFDLYSEQRIVVVKDGVGTVDDIRFYFNNNINIDLISILGTDKLKAKDYADGEYGFELKEGQTLDASVSVDIQYAEEDVLAKHTLNALDGLDIDGTFLVQVYDVI